LRVCTNRFRLVLVIACVVLTGTLFHPLPALSVAHKRVLLPLNNGHVTRSKLPVKSKGSKSTLSSLVSVVAPLPKTPFVVVPEVATSFPKPYLVQNIALKAGELPASFTTAEAVTGLLEQQPSLLVHMEVLRRAQKTLPLDQQKRLLQLLNGRYLQTTSNAVNYFDYGYAQVALTRNKTGLFFLRKANDQLKTQFTSLAYAMAQADFDLDAERSTPIEFSSRKLDVSYKIQDAVKRDAKSHQPYFWPNLMAVLGPLKAMPAYSDLAQADYSEAYVPYGNRTLAFSPRHPVKAIGHRQVASTSPVIGNTNKVFKVGHRPVFNQGKQFGLLSPEQLTQGVSDNMTIKLKKVHGRHIPHPSELAHVPVVSTPMALLANAGSSSALAGYKPQKGERLDFTKQVDLIDDGTLQTVRFYKIADMQGQPVYRMVVSSAAGLILANVETPVAPYVMEDLDNDGIFELVIRKAKIDPYNPVVVYRYSPERCSYVMDAQIKELFN
jgi:hypothetical protein